ncbi:MAG: acyl-CoA dehydrogenase family protein [Dehalococcoidia bacterium]|jgi:3-oxocholest-4-en-26-oyl-CoA dehydrogenase alpha subunit|nr:acyl-CoA dehydrogenase family protein [Dehalococcoidia bacterium]
MDFSWSNEENKFRQTVQDFLKNNWDPSKSDLLEGADDDSFEDMRTFRHKLAEQGWLIMSWPKEYGGKNASYMQQMIFKEESASYGAPTAGGAEDILAPALMVHGTDEQKKNHLPPIAKAQVLWAQGYSEPGAGSDLASLTTRAKKEGDFYIINGQKIWSSNAHRSDWMHVLVRTDPDAPKHRGISYVMMDLKTEGINIRPIEQMHARGGFNEVFFEDVKIPSSNLIGEENRGWYIAMTALDFERSGVHLVIGVKRKINEIMEYINTKKDSSMLIKKITDSIIELEIARLLSYRITSMQSKGIVPNYESSLAKTFGTELIQNHARRVINLLGMYGGLAKNSKHAPLNGTFCQEYISMVGQTIQGGTSEIQRNIMATRGLGLPRS